MKTKVRVLIEIDDKPLLRRLKRFAKDNGRTLKGAAKEAFVEYLENHKPKDTP